MKKEDKLRTSISCGLQRSPCVLFSRFTKYQLTLPGLETQKGCGLGHSEEDQCVLEIKGQIGQGLLGVKSHAYNTILDC